MATFQAEQAPNGSRQQRALWSKEKQLKHMPLVLLRNRRCTALRDFFGARRSRGARWLWWSSWRLSRRHQYGFLTCFHPSSPPRLKALLGRMNATSGAFAAAMAAPSATCRWDWRCARRVAVGALIAFLFLHVGVWSSWCG